MSTNLPLQRVTLAPPSPSSSRTLSNNLFTGYGPLLSPIANSTDMNVNIEKKFETRSCDIQNPPPKRAKFHANNLLDNFKLDCPRFYILQRENGDFHKESPIKICKEICQILNGKAKNVKKLRNGCIHIEVSNKSQADKLKLTTTFLGSHIKVASNDRLNTSKGVVTCKDLIQCSEEEILEEVKLQNVIKCRRICRKVDGELQPTPSVELTFDSPHIPEYVNIAYYRVKVRPFIPSPIRCFQCQRFGHLSKRCEAASPICSCGYPAHAGTACRNPPRCVNCGEAHNSRSPTCPTFQKEKEIQKIMSENKITYRAATTVFNNGSYVKEGVSFSKAASKKEVERAEISTQTEQPTTLDAPRQTQSTTTQTDTKEISTQTDVPMMESSTKKTKKVKPKVDSTIKTLAKKINEKKTIIKSQDRRIAGSRLSRFPKEDDMSRCEVLSTDEAFDDEPTPPDVLAKKKGRLRLVSDNNEDSSVDEDMDAETTLNQ